MTDVRLTATNPEDSSVVPVACNEKGELKLEEPITFDGNLDGDLDVSGSITAADASFGGGATKLYAQGAADFICSSGSYWLRAYDSSSNKLAQFDEDGSAIFAGDVQVGSTAADNVARGGFIYSTRWEASDDVCSAGLNAVGADGKVNPFIGINRSGGAVTTSEIRADGSASFASDVTVGSRSRHWMLVEQGGLCHMVEQTRLTKDLVNSEYPKLRDVFQELNLIEDALSQVMEKLRLTPPAGWPVWDGSDNSP